MKPLHIGLLLVGAALAGGLAVRMTQPLPMPAVAQTPASVPAPSPPAPVAAVVAATAAKPSPIPYKATSERLRTGALPRAAAPGPVYSEAPKIAVRKSKPILMARARPTQWTPGPYQIPATPARTPGATTLAATNLAATTTPAGEPSAPPARVVKPSAPPARVEAQKPRHVTLRPGMTISARLYGLSAGGDAFEASLAEPLTVDGLAIAEKGARISVHAGVAILTTSDGQQVSVATDPWSKPVSVPLDTIIRIRVASTVTITERQIASR